MKKMLVADNAEMNRAILCELFGKEYELIQTDSSEELFRLLMHYKSDISVMLVSESIAQKISAEKTETLKKLKVFANIPVILIRNRENFNRKYDMFFLYNDVVYSPFNPYTVKGRVQNLVELFSYKNKLEHQVKQQMKKILRQNEDIKVKQKKINTINNDMLDILNMVIEYRDVESGKHIRRIQKFTEVLLRALAEKYPKYNLDEEKIALITSASSMHDIGKIAIPDAILLKPGRLTPEEFQIMKMHTTKGCEILEQIESVEKNDYYKYCYDICRYHHEKWDGLGYPDGLVGDEIPIWAQVVALADCYDALTSKRPYKEAYSHEKTVDMIRDGACGAFSEEILDCFGMVLPKFKELALKYADKSVPKEESTIRKYVRNKQSDYSKDVYAKMSRDDLIEMIERQKELLKETHQRDVEVFYASSDYVFEFDLIYDTVHERKGSIRDICGYIPKNYEEAVKLFSESCPEEYRNQFIRKFRLKNIESLSNKENGVVFECLMKLGNENYSNVRCAAIPIFSEGKMIKIFTSMIELHDTMLNHIHQTAKDHDIITGLWNLNGIKREIDDYLSNTGKNGYHLMILVDGDDFGKINRQTSYRFGNEILADIAKELRKQVPDHSVLARIEDDNFLLFIKDCPDKEECMLIVEDIFRGFHKKYQFSEEVVVNTTASIGAAMYPSDGDNFDTLFENVSKAVELVKLNGKNMYMFYHHAMKKDWEIEKYMPETELLKQDSNLQLPEFEKYLIPVIHSGNGRIISYDFVETFGNMEYDWSEENAAVLSLNSIRRLTAEIYAMQQKHIALPRLSLMTVFHHKDCKVIVNGLKEILKQYPIHTGNICIMLTQNMLDQMPMNRLSEFSAAIKHMGFSLGLYQVGSENFNIKCFTEGYFDKIVFAGNFVRDISEGLYPIDLMTYFISYFDKMGIAAEIPSGVGDELIEMIRQKTPVSFGIHKEQWISLEEFQKQMEVSSAVIEYPVLSHENTSLVLSEKMYDEVLEQTKSFIMEWTPRIDRIKISGSFRKLYGYEPDFDDFVKDLNGSKFLHSDDIRKFLEKIHSARSESSYSEAFIRVYSHKVKSYIWNKVKFVAIRNEANIPIKIIAVFADVSDESETFLNDKRKDRTDFITNLYNKRATENKIKSCLYDEGALMSHSLIVAEIGGYDKLEENLGTVFANAVLKETAENIRELFRDSDIIGRSNGNRFIIFVKGMGYGEKLTEKAEQVCMVIKNRYHSDSGEIQIFGKAGVSVFPRDGGTYDELYANALKALDFAKKSMNKEIAFVFDTESDKKLLHD